MKKLLLLLTMLITATSMAYASPPDSCLKFVVVDSPNASNPYNLKIDSCLNSPTYGKEFSKGPFPIGFNYNIIPRNFQTLTDSAIYYTWKNIAFQYTLDIQKFKEMENKFGSYSLIDTNTRFPDTTTLIRRVLILYFDSYQCVDSVLEYLHIIPSIYRAVFSGGIYWITGCIEESTIKDMQKSIIITNGIINLEQLNIPDDEFIQLYDSQGQLLTNHTVANTIDISEYPCGLYFLRLNKSGKVIKIMKE